MYTGSSDRPSPAFCFVSLSHFCGLPHNLFVCKVYNNTKMYTVKEKL